MRRSLVLGVGVVMALAAALVTALPALAECSGQLNRFPPYTKVAPTADRVIIGTVTENLSVHDGAVPWFRLRVDEVLEGDAPATLEVRALSSGLPLRGSPACRRDADVYARVGDVLAIAFDGRFAGQRDVNTVAWIEGRPERDLMPGVQVLSLTKARSAAEALPPTDAAPASASAAAESSFAWLALSLAGLLGGALFLVRLRRLAQ